MADQRPIGFWLSLVDTMIDGQFADTLEEHGLTRRQWQLMNVLAQSRGATVEQLDAAVASAVSAEDSALENLAELIESSWVSSTPEGYVLTERGSAALARLAGVVADIRETMSAGLTQEEYDTTVATLERMARNLGWSGE